MEAAIIIAAIHKQLNKKLLKNEQYNNINIVLSYFE